MWNADLYKRYSRRAFHRRTTYSGQALKTNCPLQHNTVVKAKWQSQWVSFCSRSYEHLGQTLRPSHFATVPHPFWSCDSDERYRGEFMWSLWPEERVFINCTRLACEQALSGGGDGNEHPSDPQRACSQVKITLHYGSRSQHPWCMFLLVAVVKVLSFFSL